MLIAAYCQRTGVSRDSLTRRLQLSQQQGALKAPQPAPA